jgi:hypothetical protein
VAEPDDILADLSPKERRIAERIRDLIATLSPEARPRALNRLNGWAAHLNRSDEWAAMTMAAVGVFVFLCPVSTEARYARSRGRYGRIRGEDADADPATLMRKSAPAETGALHFAMGQPPTIRGKSHPDSGGSPLKTQAASATGHLAGVRLRAPAIQQGDTP